MALCWRIIKWCFKQKKMHTHSVMWMELELQIDCGWFGIAANDLRLEIHWMHPKWVAHRRLQILIKIISVYLPYKLESAHESTRNGVVIGHAGLISPIMWHFNTHWQWSEIVCSIVITYSRRTFKKRHKFDRIQLKVRSCSNEFTCDMTLSLLIRFGPNAEQWASST